MFNRKKKINMFDDREILLPKKRLSFHEEIIRIRSYFESTSQYVKRKLKGMYQK